MAEARFTSFRACPVCASHEAQMLCAIDYPEEAERLLPVHYRIAACRKCGMVYDDFDAGEALFAEYYRRSGKYEMAETSSAGGSAVSDEARWAALTRRIAPFLQDPGCAIADLGCGKGGLLNHLWRQGFRNLTGVDASQGCVDFIRKNAPFKAVCADVTTFRTARKFDLIVSSQVLEHVFDCRRYLKAVRELLAENGVLHLEMPDADGYLSHDKEAPFYFFDQEHVNHFELVSVTNLLHECGFEVMAGESFDAEPVPGFVTPNLFVTARRCGRKFPLVQNDCSAVRRYAEESRKSDEALQKLPAVSGTGFLWGVGAYCERLLAAGCFDRLKLAGLIDLDGKKQGKRVRGLEIYSPEILQKVHADYVVITSVQYESAIRETLREKGFCGRVEVLKGTEKK